MSERPPRPDGPDGPLRPGSVLYRLIAQVAGRIAAALPPTGPAADDRGVSPSEPADEVCPDDRA